MALRSGLAGQIGFAQETTWGTFKTPDHFLEFENETIKQTIARIEAMDVRTGNRTLRTDRWAASKVGVDGDFSTKVYSTGMLLLYKNMFGGLTSAADGAGWHWTSAISDSFGLGMTIQVGRPDVTGTVRAFSYAGCKVDSWELTNSVDNYLGLKVTVDGASESTSQGLASALYPFSPGSLAQEPLSFLEGTITVAGASYNITDWTLANSLGIKDDRYFIGSPNKKEQVINAYMDPTFTFTADFDGLTGYNLFVNGTLANVSLTYTGAATYDTAKPYKVVLTLPNVRFDSGPPNVSGPDILPITLAGKCLYDGTNDPIKLEAFTSESVL